MAHTVILSPRELHNARDVAAYRRAHERFIAGKIAKGHRVHIHAEPEPKVARIDSYEGWIIDCSCGAGNSTSPEFNIALCFGCGAVHENIVFPSEWKVIERLLLARPKQKNRLWIPEESVEDVRKINRDNGVSDDIDDKPGPGKGPDKKMKVVP